MFILINRDGNLSLSDANVFTGFSIVELADGGLQGSARSALSEFAIADDPDHYWINIDLVISLYDGDDPAEWLARFWVMLDSSEAYGYLNRTTNQVKAHIETQAN